MTVRNDSNEVGLGVLVSYVYIVDGNGTALNSGNVYLQFVLVI